MSNEALLGKSGDKARELVERYRGMLEIRSFAVVCGKDRDVIEVNCFDPLPDDVQNQISAHAVPFQVRFIQVDREDIWP